MTEKDERGGRLLDERGNLFGVINIVDLFVILVILAVVAAGAALVLSPGADEPSEETPSDAPNNDTDDDSVDEPTEQPAIEYATLDFGTQPDHIAERVATGDTWSPENTTNSLELTDIYRYTAGDKTGVIARTAVNGTLIESPDEPSRFEFRGERLRLGQEHTLEMDAYDVTGELTSIDDERETLPRTNETVVLDTRLSSATASAMSIGDEFTAGGDTVGELTDIERYPGDDQQPARVELSLSTLQQHGIATFGTTQLRTDSTLELRGAGYEFDGTLIHHGSLADFGMTDTRTATVALDNVSPRLADQLTTGLTEQTQDLTTAEIRAVNTTPAEVVVETDDGDLVVREHPRNVDVELELELTVRERADGTIEFRGERLRGGTPLAFDFGTVTVEGDLVSFDP